MIPDKCHSKPCNGLHAAVTMLFFFSDSYIADEMIADLRGL